MEKFKFLIYRLPYGESRMICHSATYTEKEAREWVESLLTWNQDATYQKIPV